MINTHSSSWSNAVVSDKSKYDGNGNFYSGIWHSGDWYSGIWFGGKWIDGYWCSGNWVKGQWKKGYIKSYNFAKIGESRISPKAFLKPNKTIALNYAKYT